MNKELTNHEKFKRAAEVILAQSEERWRPEQPPELQRIEELAVQLSRCALYHVATSSNVGYQNQMCEEIKKLAHRYQRSIGHQR